MVAAGVVAAAAFVTGVIALVPGGRWPVVHTVTLGVFSPLVIAFSHHFARSLTHAEARSPLRLVSAVYAGAVLVVLGVPTGQRWAVVTGASAVSVTVVVSYLQLRRVRQGAGETRFSWLVRLYERAHGAFLHGAVLGMLMGAGVLSGQWYGAARIAHLHAMVAGWIGVTILATVLFLGPVMLRTRIVGEARASSALRLGVSGLSVATVALVASGAGGAPGIVLRLAAAAGLLLYARAAVTVALVTVRASKAAQPSPARWSLCAAVLWFVVAAAADVALVAFGAWRWFDAVGVLFAVGVAGQLVAGVAVYLGPGLRGRSMSARDVIRSRLAWGGSLRTLLLNVGCVAVTLAAVTDGWIGSLLWRNGWAALAAMICWIVVALLLPLRRDADPAPPRGRSLPVVRRS